MMLSESRGEPLQTSSKKRGRREGERGERGERGEAGRGEGARDTDRAAEREREGASCFIHSLLKQTHVSFIIVTLNK